MSESDAEKIERLTNSLQREEEATIRYMKAHASAVDFHGQFTQEIANALDQRFTLDSLPFRYTLATEIDLKMKELIQLKKNSQELDEVRASLAEVTQSRDEWKRAWVALDQDRGQVKVPSNGQIEQGRHLALKIWLNCKCGSEYDQELAGTIITEALSRNRNQS